MSTLPAKCPPEITIRPDAHRRQLSGRCSLQDSMPPTTHAP